MPERTYRIAVIPGDGIGQEVMQEGVRVLDAAAAAYGFAVEQQWHDFASCDYYVRHGRMMPEDWKERIGTPSAILFGAVGWPAKVPDHVSPCEEALAGGTVSADVVLNPRPPARAGPDPAHHPASRTRAHHRARGGLRPLRPPAAVPRRRERPCSAMSCSPP